MSSNGISLWNEILGSIPVCGFLMTGTTARNLGYTENLNQVAPNTVGFAAASAGAPYPLWAYIAEEVTVRGATTMP